MRSKTRAKLLRKYLKEQDWHQHAQAIAGCIDFGKSLSLSLSTHTYTHTHTLKKVRTSQEVKDFNIIIVLAGLSD